MSYYSYPPSGGSGGSSIPEYPTFADFPDPTVAGNGAFAFALDTDILYVSNGSSWVAIAGPGVALSIGTFDSGVASANGAHIDSNALIMQSASASVPGLVNTGAQTLAGAKTFSTAPILSSLTASLPLQLDGSKNITAAAINLSGAQVTGTLPVNHGGTGVTSLGNLTEATSSVLTITGGTGALITNASIQVKLANTTTSGYLSSTDWNTFNGKQAAGNYITALTGDVTAAGPGSVAASLVATTNGTLTTLSALTTASSLATVGTITSGTWSATTIAINKGGTGQITAPAAFNALSPITTTGDMIYSPSGATSQRLAIGSTGNVLTVAGGVPTWAAPATSGTVTSVALSVPATSIFGVTGSPVTSSGTLGLTTTGTSGGIPYFSSTTQLASSALLTASQLIIGGGAGAAPATLAAGTANQYLKMNATPIPAWYTVPTTTVQRFLAPFYFTFTVTAANATAGDTYTNNGATYTVIYTIAGGTTLVTSSTTNTALSGTTLTRASGSGDATITESARASYALYQLPAGVAWIEVSMIGGGSGGVGSGSAPPGSPPTAGTSSTFLTSAGGALLTATGANINTFNGNYGVSVAPSVTSPAITVVANESVYGGPFGGATSGIGIPGGLGGVGVFGGGGAAGVPSTTSGGAARANSGAGGGGAYAIGTGVVSGQGGNAGAYVKAIIAAPSSTYQVVVGVGGTGGGAGTSGNTAGNGGSGQVTVVEYYI